MDLRGYDDEVFLKHLLGGNHLRLTLHCDALMEFWWIKRIRVWRANFENSLVMKWCQIVGRAWEQSPYFWGLVISPLHNTQRVDFIKLSDGGHMAFEFNRQDDVKCFYFTDLLEKTLATGRLCSRHESPIYKPKLERMIKKAIRSWNLLSLRFKVPKDLRQKIAKVIWDSRVEWI